MAFEWDARYAGDDYLFGEEPNAFLARQEHLLRPGMRALAVADGEGRNGVWLASRGLLVDSIDGSVVAQAKARRLADKHGVALTLSTVDLDGWEWPDETHDVVVGIFIQFAPPAMRQQHFAGMKRALKPGGLLLLEGYGPRQLVYKTGGPSQLENLYTTDMLAEAFADFTIDTLESYDAELSEGTRHKGMSALVDMVARKPLA